jgi:hypothetical protein
LSRSIAAWLASWARASSRTSARRPRAEAAIAWDSAVDDGAALREDHDAGREHDERRDQDDARHDTDSGDERHDQAGQEPEHPEPEDAQDRDDVPVRARAPEEQAGVGDVVQQRPEPVPDLVRAGLPVVHLLRHDTVGDRTARYRRDGADIAVPARVGQVQQQASRPHRRAVPATGQGNADSSHSSPSTSIRVVTAEHTVKRHSGLFQSVTTAAVSCCTLQHIIASQPRGPEPARPVTRGW